MFTDCIEVRERNGKLQIFSVLLLVSDFFWCDYPVVKECYDMLEQNKTLYPQLHFSDRLLLLSLFEATEMV